MFNADLIKDLQKRTEDLYKYLEIEKKEIEVQNEEEQVASPDFWNNAREAENFMKSLRSKKKMDR